MMESFRKYVSLLLISVLLIAACGQAGAETATAPSPAVADASQMTTVEDVVEDGMVPVLGEKLLDGDYAVTVDSSSSMFRIVEAVLHVTDGELTATITMSGGAITGNRVTANLIGTGGGVNVGSNGTLAMIGGLISGNTATYRGGGVYLYDSGTQMTMSGGTIQNNTAGSYGGGIYAGKSFTLQGTPTITDNTVNSNANNVYLNNFADTPNTINIGSNFTPSSKIGVTLVKSFKVFTSGASFADDAAAQAVFISDTPAYEVCAKSGQAALRAVHFNLWVGDDEVTGDHLSNDTRTSSFNPWTNTLTLDGYQYEGRL